jgi:hypothetical protein
MFGGEEFIDIIGDFELANSFKQVIGELFQDSEQTPEEQRLKRLIFMEERTKAHEKRIEQLSNNLKFKLSIFTDSCSSDNDERQITQALNHFIEIIRLDIPNLLQAPYGEHLLHSIGYIYSSKGRFWSSKMDSQEGHIGKRLLGYGKHVQSSWKDRAHVVKETVKTVKSAIQWGQSMSRLAQITDEEESNESQNPFQHHSGRLEYSGFNPSEATTASSTSDSPVKQKPESTTASSISDSPVKEKSESTTASSISNSPVKQNQQRKSSARAIVPLTDEEKRKLEADTAAKSIEALWRATKLEIESVERDVCDRVLNDSSCSRQIRRYRCKALSKIGELWQQASSTNLS